MLVATQTIASGRKARKIAKQWPNVRSKLHALRTKWRRSA